MSSLESFISQLRQGIAATLGISGIKALDENSNTWDECFILGVKYPRSEDGEEAKISKIESFPYFCYRFGFSSLVRSNGKELTNDIGWGCMHRSGQMLAASLLLLLDTETSKEKIISLFYDIKACPLSIQSMSITGSLFSKEPGTWLSPLSLSLILKKLLEDIWKAKNYRISIRTCGDCGQIDKDVFLSNIPLVLLCPLRLGVNKINAIYIQQLKVRATYYFGLIGGVKQASFFSLGYEDQNILCLDPHLPKPALLSCKDQISCRSSGAIRIPFSIIDPSMLIGFYFSELSQKEDFISTIESYSKANSSILSFKDDNESQEWSFESLDEF